MEARAGDEIDTEGSSGAENGQEDYARNAHASKLTVACWSRKESLGPGNPGHNGVELLAKHATVRPAELTDGDLGSDKL
jgi:hypothetical protein